MIESKARGSTLPYHQLKLVLVYSAMRHFAAELRESGWVVDYRLINETPAFEAGLRHHLETHRPDALVLAEPNSFPETDAITKQAARADRAGSDAAVLVAARRVPRLGRRAEAAAHGKSLPANAEGA
jgi:deoxyribodipyrimidine photolyase-like uncharacterized protein